MEDNFAPYNISSQLRELGLDVDNKFDSSIGFDEPCFARFRRKQFQLNTLGKPHRYNSEPIVVSDISAPLWQQIFDWFELKGFYSYIEPVIVEKAKSKVKYDYIILTEKLDVDNIVYDNLPFHTLYEARLECVKKLIEIFKNESIGI